MKKFITGILFILLASSVSFAQTSGANFLLEDSNTKSFSMGSAFTAYSDNQNSLNINPAGLGFMVTPCISADYKKNLVDGFNSSIFFAIPMKNSGVFGCGFTLFDLGSIEINYLDGTSETVKAMQSWTANIGYSVGLCDDFSLGLNLKYIKSTLADRYTGTAFAADFGLLYRTVNSAFSYGLAFQNVGTKLTYVSEGDVLPFTIRTGFAVKVRDASTDSWLITADAVYYDSKLRYNAGVECNLFKMVAIRAGYKLGYAPDTLSFGAGFNISQINIDYAYSMLGGMDNVQMFTVSYAFGGQSDYDIAKGYYDRGMKERALLLFKDIKKDTTNYDTASKYVADIEKEKEVRRQAEINDKLERERLVKAEQEAKEAKRQTAIVARLEAENKKQPKEEPRQIEVPKEKWTGTRIKVAVMNLESKNVSADTAALISDMLRNDLFTLGKYGVVERSSIDKILKEQAFQQTGCTTTECAVEVGKILNVQQTVIGTVGKLGDRFVINVRLVDVETAELIATASEECSSESGLIDICKIIAKKLSQR